MKISMMNMCMCISHIYIYDISIYTHTDFSPSLDAFQVQSLRPRRRRLCADGGAYGSVAHAVTWVLHLRKCEGSGATSNGCEDCFEGVQVPEKLPLVPRGSFT